MKAQILADQKKRSLEKIGIYVPAKPPHTTCAKCGATFKIERTQKGSIIKKCRACKEKAREQKELH